MQLDVYLRETAVGVRNRIVHDYLNIDEGVIDELVKSNAYRFVVDFLKRC